jgi:hypothetical protein
LHEALALTLAEVADHRDPAAVAVLTDQVE